MDDTKFLDRLVEVLDRGTRDEGSRWSNKLVRVEDIEGEDFEVGVLDLDDHPACYLMGFTAPQSWRVLGVVSGAFAGPLAAPGEPQVRPSAHPDAIRVRVIALTSRRGARAGRMVRPDGTVEDVGQGVGFVPDLLSRALGLPTPPPPGPPQQLVVTRWLERALVGEATDLPELLPRNAGWEFLQQRLVAGDTSWNDDYDLDPRDAAWMDTGMLARWLLAEHPPLEALLALLDRALGRDAASWARAVAARNLRQ